jgi:hypothetical protein
MWHQTTFACGCADCALGLDADGLSGRGWLSYLAGWQRLR